MAEQLTDHIKTDDFKNEKHVPVIEVPDGPKADEYFNVQLTLGKEIAHPNTTEHHIRWMALYFLPEGANQVFEVARFDFTCHGESAQGANEGPVYTHHTASTLMKTSKPGTLFAEAYCNIHGLWQNTAELKLG